MPVQTIRTAFQGRTGLGPGMAAFRFAKPEGYSFRAGQYWMLTLETAEGSRTKPFSHADAPGDPFIELGTRLTGSPFKEALASLRPGDEVGVSGPAGRLVVPEGVTRVGFLVGGVGCTPCRSILRDDAQRDGGLDAVVFLGNRDEANIAYREELEGYASGGKVRLVHVLEHPSPDWSGERGFITTGIVRRHADPADPGRHWLMAGPPMMIEAMRPLLSALGIGPERYAVESFEGYA